MVWATVMQCGNRDIDVWEISISKRLLESGNLAAEEFKHCLPLSAIMWEVSIKDKNLNIEDMSYIFSFAGYILKIPHCHNDYKHIHGNPEESF